jgi:putative membrane protein
MGVAELIPGISGSTIAVIFKIYPNLMKILSQLKLKNLTLNIRSLSEIFQLKISLPLIFSMMIAVILCSRVVDHLLRNHEELFLSSLGFLMIFLSAYIIKFFKDFFVERKLMLFLFLGLVIGFGIQELSISFDNTSKIYIFLCGMIAFSFFLIPGISGSAMLVVLGVYGPIIQAVATLDFNLLMPFAIGCSVSLLMLPKLLLSIYSSHELNLMYVFSGLILSSGIFLL